MNSDMTQGVSRRSFMRLLGAASAAATSFPAFAAMQQAAAPAQTCEASYARDAAIFRPIRSSSARMKIRWDRRSRR